MLWLFLAALALGAPVELPPGELPSTWAPTLSAAGLEPGTVGTGEGVRIVSDGSRWTLVVRDSHGVERRATVAIPRSAADREEVAALAASLLHPVSRVAAMPLPELPPLPPPTRPSAAAAPAATTAAATTPPVAEPSAPAPEPVTPTPAPTIPMITAPVRITIPLTATVPVTVTVTVPATVPVTDTVTTPPPAPPPRRDPPVEIRSPHARAWWSVAPLGLRLRSRVGVSWAPSAWLGVALPQPVRFGLGVEGILPGELQQLPDEGGNRTMSSIEGRVSAAWAPGPIELGAIAGLSRRTRHDPNDVDTPAATIGVAGGFAAVRVTVPRLTTLKFMAQVERDLTPTELDLAGVPAGRLPPLSAGLSIALTGGDGSLRRLRSTADDGRPR